MPTSCHRTRALRSVSCPAPVLGSLASWFCVRLKKPPMANLMRDMFGSNRGCRGSPMHGCSRPTCCCCSSLADLHAHNVQGALFATSETRISTSAEAATT